MQHSLYRDLFNQNGIDFVAEISFCKTVVADEKMLILAIGRGWKSDLHLSYGVECTLFF